MNLRSLLGFLGQAYERLLAVAILLLLVICMGWLVARVNNLKTEIKLDVEMVPKGADATPMDVRPLKEVGEQLARPPAWAENKDNRLFIAPIMKVLNPDNPVPQRVDETNLGEMKTVEGFPYRWLHQYNLPTDRPIANEDSDGDGFTNWEEFQAGTNPMDASSRPDVSRKLRVASILQKPFPFIFKGINEGSTRKFNIQRADGSVEHFVELGGTVPDKNDRGYKIVNYVEKVEQRTSPTMKNQKVKVDFSELTLEREGEKPVVLVRGRPATSGELSARLYFILEDRSFDVSPGMEFLLQDTAYQVVSIKRLDGGVPSVTIRRTDSPAEIPVMQLDRNDLKRNPSSPSDPLGGFPSPIPPP
ncbi:MAG: Amuc_1099 family pilus-like system protein [Verrucomicrobiia bacterium]